MGGGDGGYTSLGARQWVKGLKEGSRPHVSKVRSPKPIISTVLPLNIPRLSWNACWQLAAASLLTPTHAIHQHFVQHTNHAPVSWNLQETTTILPFLSLKITHGFLQHCATNSAVAQCCKKLELPHLHRPAHEQARQAHTSHTLTHTFQVFKNLQHTSKELFWKHSILDKDQMI